MMEKLGGQRRELGIVGLSHVSVIQQTSMLLDLMSAHKAGKTVNYDVHACMLRP